MSVDIFAQGNRVEGTWAKFLKIGDNVQGTYVGQRTAVDSYNNEQVVYELLQDDGNLVYVGVRTKAVKFHESMKHVKLGQIVGIKFTEEIKSKTAPAGSNPMKILSIFADPKIRNEEWIKEQRDIVEMYKGDQEVPTEEMSEDASAEETLTITDEPFESKEATDADKLKTITEFAEAKLGVTDPSQIKDKVMEATNLAFIPTNLDKIIEILRAK